MSLSMPSPFKHPATRVYYLRQRVPNDITAKAIGRLVSLPVGGKPKTVKIGSVVKVSLGTKDPAIAKTLYRETDVALQAHWEAIRKGPRSLSQKEIQALAGLAYKAFVAIFDRNPGEPTRWQNVIRANADASVGANVIRIGPDAERREFGLEKRFGDIVDSTLRDQNLLVDDASRRRLIAATERALTEAALTNLGKAQGDYSPDRYIERFPDWDGPKSPEQPKKRAISDLDLFRLLDHKFTTQSKAVKTKEDYRRSLNDFVKATGRTSADTITKEDVRQWRDAMIVRGLSKKTINGKHLTALKAVLTHGVEEFSLSTNATYGIQDKRDDKVPVGSKDYTLEQAEMILKATFEGTDKALAPHYQRAIFWVPWICAYTGLRVSEVTQLRGRNVREEDGVPYLLITPEDGSTKSKRAWTVGVHKHLIELGLLDMFKAIGDGPAFYRPYPEGTDLTKRPKHRSKDSAERIGNWITDEVLGESAPGGKPSYAWRHLATTWSRNFGVDKEARDYMMGSRSSVDAREGYGEWSPLVIDRETNKVGRFNVHDGGYRPTLELLVPEGLRNDRPNKPQRFARR